MPLFSALSRKMSWLTNRQKTLAENVANSDTPGFKASDLRPLDFSKELASVQAKGTHKLQPTLTDAKHMSAAQAADRLEAGPVRNANDRDINGNTVSLEDEMMKLAETQSDYQLMTNLYKKQVGLIKSAIGKGTTG